MNILPIWIAGSLTAYAAERDDQTLLLSQQETVRPLDAASSEAEKLTRDRVDKALSKLESVTDGRHEAEIKTGYHLFGLVKGGWPITNTEVERGIISAMQKNGAFSRHPEREIYRWMHDAQAAAPAIALEIRERKSKRGSAKTATKERHLNPVDLPTFAADLTVDLPYITDLRAGAYRGKPTLALKSGTGTGKTELFQRLLVTLPDGATVLIITHRVSLVKGIVKRLSIQDYQDFADLKGKDRQLVSSADRIVTTIDSLHLQMGRTFDYVIIDEAGQGLRHLIDGGTLGDRTINTYDITKQILIDAKHVWFADAALNDHDLDWLRAVRGDVYAIENTYRTPRADTTLLNSQDAGIQEAVEQVEADEGIVLIPCATQRNARHIHKLLQQRYPDKQGRLISARNSNTKDTQNFVSTIAESKGQLPADLDWLVYTHSMGTGVDIQSPVAATVGIFGQPLAPTDCMQMMGRARHAIKRFAYVPGAAGGGETDAAAMLADELLAAEESTHYGSPTPDASTKGAAKLEAIHRAQRNREFASYADYFAAYLEADGSQVVLSQKDVPSALKTDLKQIAEDESAQVKAWTLDTTNIPTVDNDMLEHLRRMGNEITDTLIAGNLRYKIENVVGLTISEDLYTRYRTAEQRKQFIRFCSLFDEQSALVEIDWQQGVNRSPLHRRKHYSAGRNLFMSILKQAFDVDTVEALKLILDDMPADELANRVGFIGQQYGKQIRALLGWREAVGSQLDNPIGLFRWICKRFKIVVSGRRTTRNNAKVWLYSLDTAEFDCELANAQARLAAQQVIREQQIYGRNPLFNSTNTDFVEKCPNAIAPLHHAIGSSWIPLQIGTGPSKINPFSYTVAITEAA